MSMQSDANRLVNSIDLFNLTKLHAAKVGVIVKDEYVRDILISLIWKMCIIPIVCDKVTDELDIVITDQSLDNISIPVIAIDIMVDRYKIYTMHSGKCPAISESDLMIGPIVAFAASADAVHALTDAIISPVNMDIVHVRSTQTKVEYIEKVDI